MKKSKIMYMIGAVIFALTSLYFATLPNKYNSTETNSVFVDSVIVDSAVVK